MKQRKTLGTANILGAKIESLRNDRKIKQKDFIAKMQSIGVDINPTSYSKLEGQQRIITDKEIYAITKILNIDFNELFKDASLDTDK